MRGRAAVPRGKRTWSPKDLRRELRSERDSGVVDLELEKLRRELEEARPRTRAECEGGARPCPFISCRYHLYLDITASGSLRLNFPGLELEDLVETCALDVAERGGANLAELGRLLNLTRQRADQLEKLALGRLRELAEAEPVLPSYQGPQSPACEDLAGLNLHARLPHLRNRTGAP